MDRSKSVAGAAAMLLACVFAVSNAAGAPDGQVRMEDITLQDLNLNTTAGVDALYQRIHAAAQCVCAVSGQAALGAESAAKCTKDAEARAVDKINVPALTAFAASR